MFDVAAYLLAKGYRGRPAAGGRELTFPCFFDCQEPADSKKRKLYVQVEEGVYNCKVCCASGGSYTLQKHFGDDPREGSSDDPFIRRRILDWAADFGAQMLAQRDDVMLYLLNERGLDPQTIVERKLGFVGDSWSLTGSLPEQFTREQLSTTGLVWKDGQRKGQDYFHRHLLIPVISRGHVVAIRGRVWGEAKGGKYLSGPGESVRAYNVDSFDGAEEVILTEGEFDAMRLYEVLQHCGDERARRLAVVGLPGTNAWPEELDGHLSVVRRGFDGGIRRIYVGFDSDEPGRLAAEKIREKFGTRARILVLPNQDGRKCDWCVDDQTEALTKRGWLRHDQIAIGDQVWSLDPDNRTASWRPVTKLFRRHRRRQMTRLAGQRHDSLTTGNHRWPVLNQADRLVWRTTDTLLLNDRIITSVPPSTDVIEQLPDPLVELVAWWVTEGSPRHSGGVEISQSSTANPENCERIRTALKHLYGQPETGNYGARGTAFWREYHRRDGIILFTLSSLAAKPITEAAPGCVPTPDFLTSLSLRQLALLLDVLIDGDGWRAGVTAIGQTRVEVNRAIEMARVLAGQSFVTHRRQNGAGHHGNRPMYETTFLQKHRVLPRHVAVQEIVDYEGIVWCPVVEGTTTWYARRNGTGYFTGNTEYLLPKGDGRNWGLEHPYAGHGAADVLRLMSAAAGKRIFSIQEAGAAFREYRSQNPGLKTGWTQLDSVLHPGLLPGQVVFLLAKTGVGKTLLLCNLAYNMRAHRILFISLEMTREEIYHRLERIYLFHHPRVSTEELERELSLIWICDENRLAEREIAALISEYEVEVGQKPDVVMVDYLGYYARGAKGSSPYEKSSNAAMQLKADAKAARVVIFAPTQVNRGAKDGKPIELDDARDSGAIEETGDFLFAAFRPDAALSDGLILNAMPTYKMKIEVLKSRHGGVGKSISLQMDALTLAIVEDGSRAARRAEEHNALAWRGHTWEDLRRDETRPVQLPFREVR